MRYAVAAMQLEGPGSPKFRRSPLNRGLFQLSLNL
jgi:hypothetical protein